MPGLRLLKFQSDLPLRVWIVSIIVFINAVSFTILIPILYPYAKGYGLSDFQASLLISSYAISQFFATPILGKLSDSYGRKPLLLISLAGTVVANLIASVAPVAWLLYAARILDGITGGNNSIANAVISDTTTASQRAKAFGLVDAAFRSGFITGPAISYVAQIIPPIPGVSRLGMSFFASATFALIATFLTLWFLPETLKQRSPQQFKLNGQLFRFHSMLQALRRPRLGNTFLLTFFSGFTFTIFAFAFQPFFLNVLKQNDQTLALMFTLIGLIGVLTQLFLVGPLTRRYNLINLLAVAIAIRGAVFLCIPVFPDFPVFLGLTCVLGITNSFPLPLLTTILSNNSQEHEQGEILGINSSVLSISNAIGPAIAGLLVMSGYTLPFWVTGILTLLTAGYAFQLKAIVNCGQRKSIS